MNKYLNHWSAKAPVFAGAPTVEDLFLTESLELHFNRLKTLCEQGHSLTLLSGNTGVGKSTLARWLHTNLAISDFDVLLMAMVQRKTKPGWVLPRIANHMGIDPTEKNISQLMQQTAERFDEFIDEKRRMIVIIDAAENACTPESFEEILGLLNLQDLAGHCLSFILIGSNELIDTVKLVPSLSSKINCHIELGPFSEKETGDYIKHRVRISGIPTNPFNDEAVALLFKATKGVASSIDAVAENCLIEAFQKGSKEVTDLIVREAGKFILDQIGDNSEAKQATTRERKTISQPKRKSTTKKNSSKKPAQTETVTDSDDSISLSSLFKTDNPS